MIYTTTQLDTDFEKVPKEIQDFVLSNEVAETVHVIAEEYAIKDRYMEEFALNICGLMIGTITVDMFLQEVQTTFEIEESRALDMLMDIDETLLEPTSYILETVQDNLEAQLVEVRGQAPANLPVYTPEPVSESKPETPSLPIISPSQQPVTGYIEDHEHLEVHIHDDSPVPLSKNGILRNVNDGISKDEDEPAYELK